MIATILAFAPGDAGTDRATLGFSGFCAVVLIWCALIWGWWRVAIIALAASAFGVFTTLAVQGFSIIAAFGGLVDRASGSLG